MSSYKKEDPGDILVCENSGIEEETANRIEGGDGGVEWRHSNTNKSNKMSSQGVDWILQQNSYPSSYKKSPENLNSSLGNKIEMG